MLVKLRWPVWVERLNLILATTGLLGLAGLLTFRLLGVRNAVLVGGLAVLVTVVAVACIAVAMRRPALMVWLKGRSDCWLEGRYAEARWRLYPDGTVKRYSGEVSKWLERGKPPWLNVVQLEYDAPDRTPIKIELRDPPGHARGGIQALVSFAKKLEEDGNTPEALEHLIRRARRGRAPLTFRRQ